MGAEEVVVGIRADEAHRLNGPQGRNGLYHVYPLVDAGMDKPAVKALCAKYDLLNPIYEWRSSVSCFCCFFQRLSDWRGLLRYHPTLYAVAEAWEKQS